MESSETWKNEHDQRDRAALCSIVAVVGAVFVVHGVNLQGFIWWALLSTLIGAMLDGNGRLSRVQRLTFSPLLALVFTTTCGGLYIIFGLGLSGYHDPNAAKGFHIAESVKRLKSIDTMFILSYGGVWVVTSVMIALANSASEQLFKIIVAANQVSETTLRSLKRKFNLYISIGVLIAGAIAKFTAG